MNPYLEARWGDVHTSLCALIRAALQPALPPGLRARAEEEVLLELPSGKIIQRFKADGVVVESRGAGSDAPRGGAVATVEPVVVRRSPRVIPRRWVQVIDTTAGNRLVTAIEILGPGNKAAGALNRYYRRKLRAYIKAGVNVVEIDLLRSSRKRLEVRTEDLPDERQAPYLVCVHRAVVDEENDEWDWEVYPMPLRDPLPTVPIPCRATDPDVPLALQPLIDRIYVDGGHDDIDYAKPPPRPRLSEEDQAWVASLVAAPRG